MEQVFLNEKCKFYAREMKANKPQMIYMNVNVNGERFVISTGVKVNPESWNVKKQHAVVSNNLTELENRNNTIVNDTITFYKTKFNDFINWLMQNPDNISAIKENICNFVPMKKNGNNNSGNNAKKKFTETLEYIFSQELDKELKEKKIEESRKKVKESSLSVFHEFIKLKNIPPYWESLTLQLYHKYKDYLLEERKTNGKNLKISSINNLLSSLKSTIEGINDRDLFPYVDVARWKLIKKQLTIDEKKTGNYLFTDEQLNSIINLTLTGTAAIIRDLFVYGCNTGQRPSDNVRLLKGAGKRFNDNGIEMLSLIPNKTRKKSGKTANVPLYNVSQVDEIIERFNTIPEYKDFLQKTDTQRNSLNSKWIKKIFALAGLNDTYNVTEQRGNEIIEREGNQAEDGHTYLSRHYFVTLMCRNNVPLDVVTEMTGHTTDTQIRQTYEHLRAEEKAKKVSNNEAVRKLAGLETEQPKQTNTDSDLKQMLADVLNVIDKKSKPDPIKLFLSLMPNVDEKTKMGMIEKTAKKFNGDMNKAAIFLMHTLNLCNY